MLLGYFVAITMVLFAFNAHAQTTTIPRNAAQLSFTPPVTNTDGTTIPTSCASGASPCGALTQHRVEYGTCSSGAFGAKQGEITVVMPAVTALVSNLVVQVYCFRAYAKNDYGVESAASTVATKTIAPPTPGAPLLAISSTAYEIRPDPKGVLTAHRVGVIPMGTVCMSDSRTIGAVIYHRVTVTRGTLDLVSWPDADPVTDVWAVCG